MQNSAKSAPLSDLKSQDAVSKTLIGLVSSSFMAALSWYTSTVYGVGLDWTDMASIVVRAFQNAFPLPNQMLVMSVLTILLVVGLWQSFTSFFTALHAGWYGFVLSWYVFVFSAALFWYDDTLVRVCSLLLVVMGYALAVLY
jgi:hypothetical protein